MQHSHSVQGSPLFADKEATRYFLQAQEESSFSPVTEVDHKIFSWTQWVLSHISYESVCRMNCTDSEAGYNLTMTLKEIFQRNVWMK